MYTIKEEREIEPEAFAHLVSSTLYERRFGPYFIEPVMAGLTKKPSGEYRPFIAASDLIGCLNFAKDFVVAGTASSKLFGYVSSKSLSITARGTLTIRLPLTAHLKVS
jgi:20S proteasome subunit beta 3